MEDDLARLRDALQLLPLAEEVTDGPGTHLRVLFQPAFHASGCLTLHLQDRVSTVEVVLRNPSARSPLPASSQADLHWATAPIPTAPLERFHAAVAGIVLAGLGDTRPHAGRDGMLIDGEVMEDGVLSTFAAWSPGPTGEPDTYQVCTALLDLARACLPDEHSQTGLAQIQRYLTRYEV